MDLHRLLYGMSLILILQFKGSKAQLSVCGKASLNNNNRIVGGDDARNGSWPWQVSLYYRSYYYTGHWCGGSLINKEYVLTAAHCISGIDLSHFTVYLGRQSQEGSIPNEVYRTIAQAIIHPCYDQAALHDSDMALLKLSSPVAFTPYISPVCLAAEDSTFYTGATSWVIGWETVNYTVSLPSPQNLQEVQEPIVGNKQCGCSYEKEERDVTENMLCAGAGGSDTCMEDSGGALVSHQLINGTDGTDDDYWVQSGVVSFGLGCALPGFPAVFARVSRFQNWINSHITTDPPGFVTITSTGYDSDEDFVCPT